MADNEQNRNDYLDLPGDPELGFAMLQKKLSAEFERKMQEDEYNKWRHAEWYADTLIAFDDVHGLDFLSEFKSPQIREANTSEYFDAFSRRANVLSQKIQMEAARRVKVGSETLVVLDHNSRRVIRTLIGAIKEELDKLALSDSKRESLFNKLNAFAEEVDRDRTRADAFFALVVEAGRTAKEVNTELLEPLQKKFDRVLDMIDKAERLRNMLPPWAKRLGIEAPPKRLPSPQQHNGDDVPT